MKLKRSFYDPKNRLSNWSDEDCCQWRGVTCNGITGHIVELDLHAPIYPEGIIYWSFGRPPSYNIVDKLSAVKIDSCLAELKHLEYLDLSGNDFNGIRIPNFFGSFKNLKYLNLSGAEFGGEIPPQLGNLTSLQVLDLNQFYYFTRPNQLHTSNLQWISSLSSLQHLSMNNANFSEPFNLVSFLSKLPSLLHLTLESCGIQNVHLATTSLNSTALQSIQSLDLSFNMLVGPIPNAFHNMTSLISLDLSYNKFNSTIPLSMVNSKTLLELRLYKTEFDKFEGGFFSFINNACSLVSLLLSGNNLGSHEVLNRNNSLSRCPNGYDLEYLHLDDFQLGGSIPDWFGQLTNLKYLFLGKNSLSNPIPMSLGKLSKLSELWLVNNQFSGSIPHSLGNLVALEYLYLSNNNLSGHVPENIGQLVNLVQLDFSRNSLDGVFSQNHLANLSNLDALNISSNRMTCNFKPNWIPPFSLSFVLDMSSCFIGPYFPMWIQTQKKINMLDLSNCNISRAIPTLSKSFSLWHLDLSNNQIIGNPLENIVESFPNVSKVLLKNNLISGSIPNSMCKLGGLYVLDLSENELSGEIPRCWEELKPLLVIDLSSNKLSGSIPNSFGQLFNLRSFHVHKNNFQGKIPQALRSCTNLEILDLGENNFSGSIPTWIGKGLSSLRILSLRNNKLSGRIPRQICDLHRLQFLDLAHNNLIGDIPRCFANLRIMSSDSMLDPMSIGLFASAEGSLEARAPIEAYVDDDPEWRRERLPVATKGSDREYTKLQLQLLKIMDLSSNKLTGLIPNELCLLSGLHGLDLSNNQLSGKIPNKIGEMTSLETLDLSNNRLFGPIPQSLSALRFISHLNLSNNDLTGRIPEGDQLRTLTDLSIYAGNSKLCGGFLPKKCAQPPISRGYKEGDKGEDTKKENILFWFVVTTGYAFGLWGVIGTLIFMKKWRIAYFQFADDKKEWILAMIAIKVARLKQRLQRT